MDLTQSIIRIAELEARVTSLAEQLTISDGLVSELEAELCTSKVAFNTLNELYEAVAPRTAPSDVEIEQSAFAAGIEAVEGDDQADAPESEGRAESPGYDDGSLY